MRHRILLVVVSLAALLLPAAVASANGSQFTTVEAPSELLFSGSPDAALDQIRDLGATAVRIQMSWDLVAPDPNAKKAPAFNQTDPNAYPAANWVRYDAAIDGARARGLKVYLTLAGSAPRWATAAKRDRLTRLEPGGVQQVRDRCGAALRLEGLVVVDLERAEPRQAAEADQGAGERQGLPAAVPAGVLRPQTGGRAGADPDRRAGADRQHLPRHRHDPPAAVPARRAVPRQPLPQGPHVREGADAGLRDAPVHDEVRAVLPAGQPGRRDDRRPLAAGEGARPRRGRGRAAAASADLRERVRRAEATCDRVSACRCRPVGLPLDRRAHGLRHRAREVVLQYLLLARRDHRRGPRAFESDCSSARAARQSRPSTGSPPPS